MWLGESFVFYWDKAKQRDKKQTFQLFFARLVVPLALTSWPLFLEVFVLGLTIGLAIGKAKLIGREIAIGLSGCLQYKVMTSSQRWWIANAGS